MEPRGAQTKIIFQTGEPRLREVRRSLCSPPPSERGLVFHGLPSREPRADPNRVVGSQPLPCHVTLRGRVPGSCGTETFVVGDRHNLVGKGHALLYSGVGEQGLRRDSCDDNVELSARGRLRRRSGNTEDVYRGEGHAGRPEARQRFSYRGEENPDILSRPSSWTSGDGSPGSQSVTRGNILKGLPKSLGNTFQEDRIHETNATPTRNDNPQFSAT